MGFGVDMAKAREIHKNNIRAARTPKLAELDIEFQKALETGASTTDIVSKKQALRDAPADADLQVETDSTDANGPKDPNAAATVLNAPTSSTKIRIGLASKAAESGEVDGLLAEGRYIIGVSYVYVDNQESFINESLGSIDVSDGHVIVIAASILDDAFTVWAYKVPIKVTVCVPASTFIAKALESVWSANTQEVVPP